MPPVLPEGAGRDNGEKQHGEGHPERVEQAQTRNVSGSGAHTDAEQEE